MPLNDQWDHDGERWALSGEVAAGASEIVELPRVGPSSVAVAPQGTGSADVEYTVAPLADVRDGSATWLAWPAGNVSAATEDGRETPTTAYRISATTEPCRVEVLQ